MNMFIGGGGGGGGGGGLEGYTLLIRVISLLFMHHPLPIPLSRKLSHSLS